MIKIAFSKISLIAALILIVLAGILVSGKSESSTSAFKPGTIYTRNSAGEQVIAYNAGHTYALDKNGLVIISYNNGKSKVKAPLILAPASGDEESGMTISETDFIFLLRKQQYLMEALMEIRSRCLSPMTRGNHGALIK